MVRNWNYVLDRLTASISWAIQSDTAKSVKAPRMKQSYSVILNLFQDHRYTTLELRDVDYT